MLSFEKKLLKAGECSCLSWCPLPGPAGITDYLLLCGHVGRAVVMPEALRFL